jgi:hypothetical protein
VQLAASGASFVSFCITATLKAVRSTRKGGLVKKMSAGQVGALAAIFNPIQTRRFLPKRHCDLQ